MKQTAVDILYKFLYEMESFDGFNPYDFNHEEVFARAKAMEKEQLIMFGAQCMVEVEKQSGLGAIKIYELYYNETFKSE